MLGKDGFDAWALDYDEDVKESDLADEYPFAGYAKILESIFAKVMDKHPSKILDMGIGTGVLSTQLYERGNKIWGMDFSDQMLKICKEKMPNASFIQHDFTKPMPQIDEKFDFIISNYALHHLDDIAKISIITELAGLLEADGVILIGDIAFDTRGNHDTCRNQHCNGLWDDDEYYFVAEEILPKLKGIGLGVSYTQISHCGGIFELRRQ